MTNFKIKEIEKIEFFFKQGFTIVLVDYKHDNTLTWQEFLMLFFKELNKKYYSVSTDKIYYFQQLEKKDDIITLDGGCLKGKNRSLVDIYSIVRCYYNNICLCDIMGWLYENLTKDAFDNVKIHNWKRYYNIGVLNCPNIKKRVFHNLNIYGCHYLKNMIYDIDIREKNECCDENGFYFAHYRAAYLKYKKNK